MYFSCNKARIGLICMPSDEAAKEKILELSQTKNKYQFLGFYDAMWSSIWISTIFGLLFFMISFYYPYRSIPWIMFLGGIISVLLGGLTLMFAFFVILGIYTFKTLINEERGESIYIGMRMYHSAANL